ncbi:protein trapped in endoderm-1-like [Amphiura filiformis]|uniref:protein trapped in endoderm-1-like n=1 Tax=Amphiura filiformis TaxID=82378 RepID=UPI003B21E3AC
MESEDNSSLSITTQISTSPDDLIIEEPRKYPEFIRFAALIIGIPIMVTGILGNLLTIVAVLKTKSLRTGTNIFIISLSACDLSYSCIIMPTVMTIHWNNAWVFSGTYCKMYPVILFMVVGGGLVSLSGTAVTRYLKILHPKGYNFIFGKKFNTAVLLGCFWLSPVLILLPAMTGVWGQLGYEPKTLTCTFLRDGSNYNTLLQPQESRSCKTTDNSRNRNKWNISSRTEGEKEDLRYTRMMATIFILFLLSYSPYMINNLLDPDHQNLTRGFFSASCVWLSVCLNPVVYVLLNRQFRQAFLSILPCTCGRCNPDRMEQSLGTLSTGT